MKRNRDTKPANANAADHDGVTIVRAPTPPAWRVAAALDVLLELLDSQADEKAA